MSMKNSIEPTTFRLVVQCLNQMQQRLPVWPSIKKNNEVFVALRTPISGNRSWENNWKLPKKKSSCHNLFPVKCPNQTLSECKAMLCLAIKITGRSSGFYYGGSRSSIYPGDQLSWLMFASVPPAQHSDIISNYTTTLSYTVWPLLNPQEQCLYLQHTQTYTHTHTHTHTHTAADLEYYETQKNRAMKQYGHDSGLNHILLKINILYFTLNQGSDTCPTCR